MQADGIIIVKTKQAVLVCEYSHPALPGEATKIVEVRWGLVWGLHERGGTLMLFDARTGFGGLLDWSGLLEAVPLLPLLLLCFKRLAWSDEEGENDGLGERARRACIFR